MELLQDLTTVPGVLRLDLLGKLLLAAILGGVIGFEREISDKPAGLRTNLLICVGAALLADVSVDFATTAHGAAWIRADPGRIAAQIVSGVGFLGAGTIIQARGSVTGLTTAATLWVVAAIGLAVGGGAHVAAIGATGLVLIALVPLSWLEERIGRRRVLRRALDVVLPESEGAVSRLEEALDDLGVEHRLRRVSRDPSAGRITVTLEVTGGRDAVGETRRTLLEHDDVREIAVLDPGGG